MAIPLVAPIITGVVEGLVGASVFGAVNNYITKPTSAGSSTPTIPTSKRTAKLSPKVSQKKALGDYALGVGGTLAAVAATVGTSVNNGKSEADSFSAQQSSKTDELAATSSASPLLTNQVFMKDSIDKLIDAINANTLVSATVFGTLDANLSSIGSTLTAISSTLIEVSDNYSSEINNTDDLPYIDKETYYDMLDDAGMNFYERNDYMEQEDKLADALIAQGYSYSDVKAEIQKWRSTTIPIDKQLYVDKEVSGVSKPSKVDSSGKVASPPAVEIPAVEKWAESQLAINEAVTVDMFKRNIHSQVAKNEYITTETEIKDLDGELVANIKPMEVTAIKSATEARLRTDMNNYKEDDDDIDFAMGDNLDLSALFQFKSKSDRLNDIIKNGITSWQ